MPSSFTYSGPAVPGYIPGGFVGKSSGYWANPLQPGVGKPEDLSAGLRSLQAGTQLQPAQRMALEASGVRVPTTTPKAPATTNQDLLEPRTWERSPMLSKATQALWDQLGKASGAVPDYRSILDDARRSREGIGNAFNRYEQSLDPTEYARLLRQSDREAAGLTREYTGTARGIADQVGDTISRYGTAGRGLVDDILKRGDQYSADLRGKYADLASDLVTRNLSRYGINKQAAGGTARPGSEEIAMGGKAYAEAVLPYMERAMQNEIGLRRDVALPFEGDMASRQTNYLQQMRYPMEGDLYNRQLADVARSRQSTEQIQQMKMETARMGVDAAVRRYVTDVESARQMAEISGLPVDEIMRRARAAGTLRDLERASRYESLEYTPGTGPLSVPQSAHVSTRGRQPYVQPYDVQPRTISPDGGQGGPGVNSYYGQQAMNRGLSPTERIYMQNTGVDPRTDPLYSPDVMRGQIRDYASKLPVQYYDPPPNPGYNEKGAGWSAGFDENGQWQFQGLGALKGKTPSDYDWYNMSPEEYQRTRDLRGAMYGPLNPFENWQPEGN